MKAVFTFFALVVVLKILWILAPVEIRASFISTIKKYVLPAVLFSAAVTIALLAFAFFSNGKVI